MKTALYKFILLLIGAPVLATLVACQSLTGGGGLDGRLSASISANSDDTALAEKASALKKKVESAKAVRDDLTAAQTQLELQGVMNKIYSRNRDKALLLQALHPEQTQKHYLSTEANNTDSSLQYSRSTQVPMLYRSSLDSSLPTPIRNTYEGIQ